MAHPHAQPPVLVPQVHRAEMETLSKAAHMDIIWDLIEAIGKANGEAVDGPTYMIDQFRLWANDVLAKRKQAAKAAPPIPKAA